MLNVCGAVIDGTEPCLVLSVMLPLMYAYFISHMQEVDRPPLPISPRFGQGSWVV